MCESRRPENGADSVTAYRVTLKDTEGPAWSMTVTASDPDIAKSIARRLAYEDGADAVGVIGIEVATPKEELKPHDMLHAVDCWCNPLALKR